ncbi:MAG: hypothetical protein ACLS9K_11760 [Lachnospira eligens]
MKLHTAQRADKWKCRVTLTANEDVRSVSGFTKVDNRTYKKTYTSNAKEDVTVYDKEETRQ